MINERVISPEIASIWDDDMILSEIPKDLRTVISEMSLFNPVRNTNWKYLKFHDSSVFNPAAQDFNRSLAACKGTHLEPSYTNAIEGTVQYNEYWEIQKERCLNGYEPIVNGVPCGVKITGEHYFYLNFTRIQKYTIDSRTGEEIKQWDFPDFFSMDYYWFLELEKNENPGKYGLPSSSKKGMICAKARRKGFSFKNASGALWKYTFFKESYIIIAAYLEEYANATMSMVLEMSNFLNQYTEFRHPRIISRQDEIKSGYKEKDANGIEVEKGYKSVIKIMTFKNSAFKSVGKCFTPDTEIIMYDGSLKKIQDIIIGDKVLGPDGNERTVLNTHSGRDSMYLVRQSNGDDYIVNSKHDLYLYDYYNKDYKTLETKEWNKLPEYLKNNGYKGVKSSLVNFKEKELSIDPYYLGLWLGDGSKSTLKITSIDKEIQAFIEDYAKELNLDLVIHKKSGTLALDYSISKSKDYNNRRLVKQYNLEEEELKTFNSIKNCELEGFTASNIHKACKTEKPYKGFLWKLDEKYYNNTLKESFKKYSLLNNKHIPKDFLINSKENRLQLLAGLIDTDGSYTLKNNSFEIIQKNKVLINDIKFLCESLGFRTTLHPRMIKDRIYYRLYISGNIEIIPTKLKRKQAVSKTRNNHLHNTLKITELGIGDYYGFECDKDHLFLLKDFTIVHNSATRMIFEEAGMFQNLKTAYTMSEPLFRDGDRMIGIPIIFGTGGDMTGGSKDFSDMFYNPKQYGLAEYHNIYEKNDVNGKCGWFVDEMWYRPSEIVIENKLYQGVDKNGNANRWVAEANLDIERDSKRGSDKKAYNGLLTQKCKTPSEAFLVTEGNIFQTAELYARLSKLKSDDTYKYLGQAGELVEREGRVWWEPDLKDKLRPILSYPLKQNTDTQGAIVIYEHPLEFKGEIPDDLYIIGHDPWGIDAVGGKSLGAAYVIKTKKLALKGFGHDEIVAEYVGRPDPGGMDEYNYNLEKMALYFNAKINFENDRGDVRGYFTKRKRLDLLCPPPYTIIKRDIPGSNMAGRKYGYSMGNDKMKQIGEQYLYDWLAERRGTDEKGVELTNIDFIPSKGLLEELIGYNRGGNFDRVLALIGCIIRLEEIHNPYEKEKPEKDPMDFIFNNPYLFKKNKVNEELYTY